MVIRWMILFTFYSVMIPCAWVMLIPFRDVTRLSYEKTRTIMLTALAGISVLFTYIEYTRSFNALVTIGIFLLVIPSFLLLRADFRKILYQYLVIAAVVTLSGMMYRQIGMYFQTVESLAAAAVVRWLFILLLLFFVVRMKEQLVWLFHDFNEGKFWNTAWAAPVTITVLGYLIFYFDRTRIQGKAGIFLMSVLTIGTLCISFCLNEIALLQVAKLMNENREMEKVKWMQDVQVKDYVQLRAYMDQTSKERHDFRHIVGTLQVMLEEGRFQEAEEFCSAYFRKDRVRSSRVNFCENSAVNALLRYYSTVAESAGVNLKVSSVVPKDLGIAAEDLCVLIGNLLDNAVQAAAAVPEDLRVVDLDLEKEERGAFYLSMVNPYAGERVKINGQYRSQKKNGGIGLKSVMQITEKYHGQARFRDADGVFYTSVMLEEVE